MTVKRLSPEALLALDRFQVDEGNPHIQVDPAVCDRCQARPCLVVCPARCYQLTNEHVHFEYAGCLECGTCRVLCSDRGITQWQYPGASYGVTFRCS